jgi:hypothetical protein
MGPRAVARQTHGKAERAEGSSLTWMAVVWGRVVVGLALATVGGAAFGHAWTREETPSWSVGGISLLTGTLLALSGFHARSRPPGVAADVVTGTEPDGEYEPVVPLLGAILVHKYRWITQQQLDYALEQQRREGPGRPRLGEILLDTGAISLSRLEQALEHQRMLLQERGVSVT